MEFVHQSALCVFLNFPGSMKQPTYTNTHKYLTYNFHLPQLGNPQANSRCMCASKTRLMLKASVHYVIPIVLLQHLLTVKTQYRVRL